MQGLARAQMFVAECPAVDRLVCGRVVQLADVSDVVVQILPFPMELLGLHRRPVLVAA